MPATAQPRWSHAPRSWGRHSRSGGRFRRALKLLRPIGRSISLSLSLSQSFVRSVWRCDVMQRWLLEQNLARPVRPRIPILSPKQRTVLAVFEICKSACFQQLTEHWQDTALSCLDNSTASCEALGLHAGSAAAAQWWREIHGKNWIWQFFVRL